MMVYGNLIAIGEICPTSSVNTARNAKSIKRAGIGGPVLRVLPGKKVSTKRNG